MLARPRVDPPTGNASVEMTDLTRRRFVKLLGGAGLAVFSNWLSRWQVE